MTETWFKIDGMCGVLTSFTDPGIYKIEVEGRHFSFEYSRRFGPNVVGKAGQEVKQPGPRHNFWKAVSLWDRQGKRVDDNGLCVYERKPPVVRRHLGGGHYEILSGETCEVWPQPPIDLPQTRPASGQK